MENRIISQPNQPNPTPAFDWPKFGHGLLITFFLKLVLPVPTLAVIIARNKPPLIYVEGWSWYPYMLILSLLTSILIALFGSMYIWMYKREYGSYRTILMGSYMVGVVTVSIPYILFQAIVYAGA